MKQSVSVIIPTYNGERFLAEALDSLFAQTKLPHEIIAVDDASSDSTWEILQGARRRSPVEFRVCRNDANSGGPAGPINTGLRGSSGELFAILEQDDRMEPTKLEQVCEAFRCCPTLGLAVSRYLVIAERGGGYKPRITDDRHSGWEGLTKSYLGNGLYLLDGPACYAVALESNFAVSFSNLVFRRSVLAKWNGLDDRLRRAADYAVLLRALRETEVGFIDAKLWSFRRHAASAVATTAQELWDDDFLRVYRTERLAAGSGPFYPRITARVRQLYLSHAYGMRQQHKYVQAVKYYLTSILEAGASGEAVAGLAKLIPHAGLWLFGSNRYEK